MVGTNMEIDAKFMKDVLRATGANTKCEAVQLGLEFLMRLRVQVKALRPEWKITWDSKLRESPQLRLQLWRIRHNLKSVRPEALFDNNRRQK